MSSRYIRRNRVMQEILDFEIEPYQLMYVHTQLRSCGIDTENDPLENQKMAIPLL